MGHRSEALNDLVAGGRTSQVLLLQLRSSTNCFVLIISLAYNSKQLCSNAILNKSLRMFNGTNQVHHLT